MAYYARVQLKPSNGHKKNRYEKAPMNLLTDDLFKVYRKFLAAAFGSARITSIYSVVDAAMVGKYHGPDGLSAIAILVPMWNIVFSLSLLAGSADRCSAP